MWLQTYPAQAAAKLWAPPGNHPKQSSPHLAIQGHLSDRLLGLTDLFVVCFIVLGWHIDGAHFQGHRVGSTQQVRLFTTTRHLDTFCVETVVEYGSRSSYCQSSAMSSRAVALRPSLPDRTKWCERLLANA